MKWIPVAFILGAVLTSSLIVGHHPVEIEVNSPVTLVAPYEATREPQLEKLAKELGIDYSSLNLTYKSLNFPQEARYIEPNTLEFDYSIPRPYEVMAHEYMHFVWEKKLDNTTREKLTKYLKESYYQDPAMKPRMQFYLDRLKPTDYTFTTELFAIYCTERADYVLSDSFLKLCNQYIPYRHLVESEF